MSFNSLACVTPVYPAVVPRQVRIFVTVRSGSAPGWTTRGMQESCHPWQARRSAEADAGTRFFTADVDAKPVSPASSCGSILNAPSLLCRAYRLVP
jgi:hypothetical protein